MEASMIHLSKADKWVTSVTAPLDRDFPQWLSTVACLTITIMHAVFT
jgi:hypothetical protein